MNALKDSTRQRLIYIRTMLVEMACSNFYYRIKRSEKDDLVEGLIVTINMFAEEIQDSIIHQGYANRSSGILDIVQMTYMLDEKGIIRMVNDQANDILFLSMEDVVGRSFASLLDGESAHSWNNTWSYFQDTKQSSTVIDITFFTKMNLLIPKVAHLARLSDIQILVTIIHHTNTQSKVHSDMVKKYENYSGVIENADEGQLSDERKPKMTLSYDDIRKVRQAHDRIIRKPEFNFPPLKVFALEIGTNDFKLKYAFKKIYGITVHGFIMQERLRKAQMMVEHSDRSFKSIASMSGFKSMPHFSRAFKAKYGFSPRAFRKQSLSRND